MPNSASAVKSVALACQGGGSHCAFGAGVLAGLLGACNEERMLLRGGERHCIIGVSGTSGGAINALLAWYGLVHPAGPVRGIEALRGFWQDTAAHEWWDLLANFALVSGVRLRGILPQFDVAPNALSDAGHARLARAIEAQVEFARLPAWVDAASPRLLIGAADVLSGDAVVFGARRPHVPDVREILASTAVPELFRPVALDIAGERRWFWDGLLSQNPPVRDFLAGVPAHETPDEIWLIRINPARYEDLPRRLWDIMDRRNEMAGNLALAQERFFVEHVNDWLARGLLPASRYKPVAFREIALEELGRSGGELDYASKLDRRPAFIDALMRRGLAAGERFLAADATPVPAPRAQVAAR